MTNQEKKDTLDNMLICYVDRTYLTNKQIEESEIFIEELKAAISVTRCCKELPTKEDRTDDILEAIKKHSTRIIDHNIESEKLSFIISEQELKGVIKK